MKLKHWLLSILTGLAAMAAVAQDAAPSADTSTKSAPKDSEARAKPKKTKVGTVKSDVVLDPPAAATVKQESLNVRGQPSFVGEVVAHLKRGETVTVLEQITLATTKKGEPANWARISMPTNTPVWVDAEFIDPKSKAVLARRINVRGGPGENYSVVARLEKGTIVKEIRRNKNWMEIETPANAYAFVAADYLEIQAPAAPSPAAPSLTSAPATGPVPTTEPPPAPAPTPAPEVVNVPAETTTATAAKPEVAPAAPEPVAPAPTASAPEPAPAPAATGEPATQVEATRSVIREGFLNKARNIQAPADFELRDIQSGDVIEFIQPKPKQNLKAYVGTRVTVAGHEVLDHRWPRTPIIELETIDLMP
jgi:uncharacterized protein YgiM (DUF1202 family)